MMKARLQLWKDKLFPQVGKLTPGIYHYQSPPDYPKPYRLHLRIEPSGNGILIINAKTVLHLNQTASEYAYLLVKETPSQNAAKEIRSRYRIGYQVALNDFTAFSEKIHALLDSPDLAPDMFLDFARVDPYSQTLTAPYRLDCALTYRCSGEGKNAAPVDRVTHELTTEEWFAILKKAWNAGIPHVVFTGGEPTLRPDLPDLIAEAERLGQVSGLITDGLRLSDPKYLRSLLQAGLDHLMIILESLDEQNTEAIRDVIAEDIFINLHLTITKKNSPNLEALIEQLIKLGVKSFSLSISDLALKERQAQIRDYLSRQGMSLVWDLPVPYSQLHPVALELKEHEQSSKGAGKAWLYVEPDGDVLPEQGENRVLGNLSKDSWESIWQNAQKG